MDAASENRYDKRYEIAKFPLDASSEV
jgi:hypothetical protein